MHEIQVHNTYSGKVEPFVPLKAGEVRMYTCGPTVYDYAHIGNFRTFVFQDILRRFLKLRGFKLTHVMNLTDVDDRIIANSAAAEALTSVLITINRRYKIAGAGIRITGMQPPPFPPPQAGEG